MQTQWVAGMNGPTGLDYTRVRAGLEMAGIEVTRELFEKLQIIESAVLAALANKPSTSPGSGPAAAPGTDQQRDHAK